MDKREHVHAMCPRLSTNAPYKSESNTHIVNTLFYVLAPSELRANTYFFHS